MIIIVGQFSVSMQFFVNSLLFTVGQKLFNLKNILCFVVFAAFITCLLHHQARINVCNWLIFEDFPVCKIFLRGVTGILIQLYCSEFRPKVRITPVVDLNGQALRLRQFIARLDVWSLQRHVFTWRSRQR